MCKHIGNPFIPFVIVFKEKLHLKFEFSFRCNFYRIVKILQNIQRRVMIEIVLLGERETDL